MTSSAAKERFANIAGRYDFMNHLLSLDMDKGWREAAAEEAMLGRKSFRVLDSATGTGDLAFAVYDEARNEGKSVRMTATDFVREMLDIAVEKAKRTKRAPIDFRLVDSLKTGFRSGSFDVVITGFALRNFDSVDRFLAEAYRVLSPRGRLVILEMAMPDLPAQRLRFALYSYVMRFASIFAGKEYGWLVDSIEAFDKKALKASVRRTGFRSVRMRSLRSGVAYLLVADK